MKFVMIELTTTYVRIEWKIHSRFSNDKLPCLKNLKQSKLKESHSANK